MAKAEENFKRYRFSVPHADVSINKWVEQQSNLSMSLRMLIGECIEKSGYGDYTCRERIPGARRGRPPKASYENEDQESDMDSAVSQPVTTERKQEQPVAKPTVTKPGPLSDDDIAAMFN